VAIANDATYGYDVGRTTRPDGGTTTTARLSLVRAPRSPDPEADQGPHRMTYALVPGASIAEAVAAGYALNLPLRTTVGEDATPPAPLLSVDGAAVRIEALKLADDRSGDVVVRLYESLGGRADTRLRPSFRVRRADVTDLLERPMNEPIAVDADGSISIRLRAFQIMTLRLSRR